jgi:16S rRNA (cytidine1402-2'-O)-methyltransferase
MNDGDPGTLIVAAAPIGQPADASPRLASALAGAAVIAAEDTRRVRRLAAALGVAPAGRIVSYYDVVERSRVEGLLSALRGGDDVLLVTDAGMPGVSDPGYRLVAAAAAAGVAVTVLPGPSAVTAALAVSGLPTDRFCFEGFPPRGAGERARRFAELAAEPRTLVFFESRRRVKATLSELAAAFGPERPAVACRELTKTHEEIRRGTLGDLAEWARGNPLGEITLVVAGAPAGPGTGTGAGRVRSGWRTASPAERAEAVAEAAARVAAREAAGTPRKQAIADVARESGLPKREVYDTVVRGPGRHQVSERGSTHPLTSSPP